MPPLPVAGYVAAAASALDVKEKGQITIPALIDPAGTDLDITHAELMRLIGTFSPANMRAIVGKFSRLGFKWDSTKAVGHPMFVSKSPVADPAVPASLTFAEAFMRDLGVVYIHTAGAEFAHAKKLIPFEQLAEAPMGKLIMEKDTTNTLTAKEVGQLAYFLVLAWRAVGMGEGPGDMYAKRYMTQKKALEQRTSFKKYPGVMCPLLAWYGVSSSEVKDDLAEVILSITVTCDLLMLSIFETPDAFSQVISTYESDITALCRSLSKRKVLEFEKRASLILESEAYEPHEQSALRAMKTRGLTSLALGGSFMPECPPGETCSAWLQDLTERISLYTQGYEKFVQTRGEASASSLVRRFPALADEEKF